jgi:N utilization substance protein B
LGQRRKARELAAQTLYALEFKELDSEFREYGMLNSYPEVMQQLAHVEKLDNSPVVLDFAEDLVKNAIINQESIKAEIEKHSEHWREENIARLDRGILHVAVYELMFTDTPAAVVINEALEIAKKYCSEGTGKFLNGILDAVKKEMQDKERIEGSKA